MRYFYLLLALLIASPCWAGASRDFGGTSSDYLENTSIPKEDIDNGDFSLVAWVYQDDDGGTQNVGGNRSSNNTGWEVRTSNSTNNLGFTMVYVGDYNSTLTLSTTTWHFIGVVHDDTANTAYYYLDDSTDTDTVGNPHTTNLLDGFWIGKGWWGGHFDGKLAYVQLFNKALTAQEYEQVRWHPGSITDGLVGYWPLFGESSPEEDLSGNGYTATINGTISEASDGPPVFLSTGPK